jgi:hypothetical protein
MICADCLIPEFWFRIVPIVFSGDNSTDNNAIKAVVVGYAVDTFADAITELTEEVALQKVSHSILHSTELQYAFSLMDITFMFVVIAVMARAHAATAVF